jgi:hypothetical protein
LIGLFLNLSFLFSQKDIDNFPLVLNSQPHSELIHPDIMVNADDFVVDNDTTPKQKGKLKAKLDKFNEFMQWYLKYFPFPYGSYSIETNLLFGLSKYNAFTLGKHHVIDSITQPSSLSAFGYFTTNKQYKCILEANLMFHQNKSQWKTTLGYTEYPMEFFGYGNATNLAEKTTLVTTNYQLNTYYLFKTFKKWYFGPTYDFYNFRKVELQGNDENIAKFESLVVGNLGIQSGAGLKLLMEGRDNRLNAKHGFYTDISYQVYRKDLGGDYNYDLFQADFRYYTPLYKRIILATQVRTESRTGNVPLQSLAMIGGDYTMRGIYRGRFRDNVSVDGQMEVRFPLFWIFSGVVFNGIGEVAPSYEKLNSKGIHYTYGAGLRVKMDTKHDVNLRFDVGRSYERTIFVVNISEAF